MDTLPHDILYLLVNHYLEHNVDINLLLTCNTIAEVALEINLHPSVDLYLKKTKHIEYHYVDMFNYRYTVRSCFQAEIYYYKTDRDVVTGCFGTSTDEYNKTYKSLSGMAVNRAIHGKCTYNKRGECCNMIFENGIIMATDRPTSHIIDVKILYDFIQAFHNDNRLLYEMYSYHQYNRDQLAHTYKFPY